MYLGVNKRTRAIRKKARSVFLSILSYWVVPTIKEGITFKDSFGGKVHSPEQALSVQGLKGIIRATRVKPASFS